MSHTIIIYTDGSALGNPGKAGWGFLVWNKKEDSATEFGGHSEYATNNQMELTAFLESLKFINELKEKENIVIHLDSEYVKNGITSWIKNWKKNGWRTAAKKPVLNKELWQEIDESYEKAISLHEIELRYVPGHMGIGGNEAVDLIAREMAGKEKMQLFKGSKKDFEELRGFTIT